MEKLPYNGRRFSLSHLAAGKLSSAGFGGENSLAKLVYLP